MGNNKNCPQCGFDVKFVVGDKIRWCPLCGYLERLNKIPVF